MIMLCQEGILQSLFIHEVLFTEKPNTSHGNSGTNLELQETNLLGLTVTHNILKI